MSQARGIMAKMCVCWWSLPFPVKRVNTWNISWLWVETKYYAIRGKAFYLLNMLSMLDFFYYCDCIRDRKQLERGRQERLVAVVGGG